eukprot:CAMPEP_0196572032 /NCGR_PEP_ID=MMETSP1081-20130531/2154_1 /TAXON_ID=36882 /ORGANISM="Pyramimonas amylifera, Strain CCMP720" /LENGTH=829 /DNA_ID=CAMNT_0041889213 /DNA_START=35 /DNA_END=2524 /DNA_ORIENTATION=+
MLQDEGAHIDIDIADDWMNVNESGDDEDGDSDIESWELHNVVEEGNVERLTEILRPASKLPDVDFNPDPMQEEEEAEKEEVDVDKRDDDGLTPLHVALLNGQLDCLRLLLEAGAETLIRCEGSPGLHIAVSMGILPSFAQFSIEAVKALLASAPEVNILDDLGRSALHLCADFGLPAQTELLLQAGSLVNVRDRTGQFPAHYAASHPQVLSLLLAGGANACSLSGVRRSPLHAAADAGCRESIRLLLLAAPESLGMEDKWGLNALQLASRKKHVAAMEILQAAQTDPSADLKLDSGSSSALDPAPLLIVAPKECHLHITCGTPVRGASDTPPENDSRLTVLTHPDRGILRSSLLSDARTVWPSSVSPAAMVDVLRVHDYPYVKRLQEVCARLNRSTPTVFDQDVPIVNIGQLDSDTAICSASFQAALFAAGAAITAVNEVVSGRARHAFCPVRPPGHHAGPSGIVGCDNNPAGSHGFCLLNTAAIAAAYARCIHRPSPSSISPTTPQAGVRKVAIVDFDVHHGNGTQACVAGVLPTTHHLAFSTSLADGTLKIPQWKPWLDAADADQIFLAGTQGYGGKMEEAPDPHDEDGGCFYPGSGASCTTRGEWGEVGEGEEDYTPRPCGKEPGLQPEGPWVVNVGIPGPGARADLWRRAWVRRILPALDQFNPDLIIISAGFDAHRKDLVNCGYVGIEERDYAWITDAIIQVANKCCSGRIVSVLEGGYRIQGGVVSAFSRSVLAHVATLSQSTQQVWSSDVAEKEMFADRPEFCEEAQSEEDKIDEKHLNHSVDYPSLTRKRRREPVDYTALNAQMDLEKKTACFQNDDTKNT